MNLHSEIAKVSAVLNEVLVKLRTELSNVFAGLPLSLEGMPFMKRRSTDAAD